MLLFMLKREDYKSFVEKFKPKKTTDDCYTPGYIYEIVADWVAKEYDLDRRDFVRPFYPGGDFEGYDYKDSSVVVDNPPFSILQRIVEFYHDRGIRFFLFAPGLVIFRRKGLACAICSDTQIIYENGAVVRTGFLTNLEPAVARSAPDLYREITKAIKEKKAMQKKKIRKLEFPHELITASQINSMSKHGVSFKIMPEDCSERTSKLDMMDGSIFGGGYLLSEKAIAEKAIAEKAAAEKERAEKERAEKEREQKKREQKKLNSQTEKKRW